MKVWLSQQKPTRTLTNWVLLIECYILHVVLCKTFLSSIVKTVIDLRIRITVSDTIRLCSYGRIFCTKKKQQCVSVAEILADSCWRFLSLCVRLPLIQPGPIWPAEVNPNDLYIVDWVMSYGMRIFVRIKQLSNNCLWMRERETEATYGLWACCGITVIYQGQCIYQQTCLIHT